MMEVEASAVVLPPHEGLVDGGSKVEDVVTDSQVVLQAEGLQHHSIPDRERQPQLLIGVCCEGGKCLSHTAH